MPFRAWRNAGDASGYEGDEGAPEPEVQHAGEPGKRCGRPPDTEFGDAQGMQYRRESDKRGNGLNPPLRQTSAGGVDNTAVAGGSHTACMAVFRPACEYPSGPRPVAPPRHCG